MNLSWKAGGLPGLLVGLLALAGLTVAGVTEEVQTGTLVGQAVMPSGRGLPRADVVLSPTFPVPEGAPRTRYTQTDDAGRFTVRFLPVGLYDAYVTGKAHNGGFKLRVGPTPKGGFTESELQSVYGEIVPSDREWATTQMREELAKAKSNPDQSVTLQVSASVPDLEMTAVERTWLPDETPQVRLNGLGRGDAVQLVAYRFGDAILAANSAVAAVAATPYGFYEQVEWNPEQLLERVEAWTHPLTTRDLEGQFVETIPTPKLEPGTYLVRAKLGDSIRDAVLDVTTIGLVAKAAGLEIHAYVADLASGAPIAGASVQLLGTGVSASTGVEGVATFDAPAAGNMPLLIARAGGSRAIVQPSLYAANRGEFVWFTTDRPIYRPGDTVHYRLVLRKQSVDGYAPTDQTAVPVVLSDPDGVELSRTTLSVGEFGSAHGEFATPAYALPGYYTVEVGEGTNQRSFGVTLAAYRKPEMEITVKPEKPVVVRGEPLRATVHCKTFTGEPVVGARVDLSLYTSSMWSGDPFDEDESLYADEADQGDWYGELADEVELYTDEKGEARVAFPTARQETGDLALTDDRATIVADVQDAAGRSFEGKARTTIVRGEVDLSVQVERSLLDPGQTTTATVRGLRQVDRSPAAGQEVEVTFGREVWGREESVFVPEGQRTLMLDAEGGATLQVSASKAGSLIVKASTLDAKGNRVRAEGYAYVFGTVEGGPARDAPTLQLVLDRKQYQPGESALALVRTSEPGGSAWVTVETDRVRWSKVVQLREQATRVDLPTLDEDAPNAFVSVTMARGKRMSSAQRVMNVDLSKRRLEMNVAPDRPDAKPGEVVRFRVTTARDDGAPTPAEVSLAVVDEGVYAVREDTQNPLADFYPRRSPMVNTTLSVADLTYGNDKSEVQVELRKDFKDTAAWFPSVRTDGNGEATVDVRLPDNLTRWRATAVGVTSDTSVGKTTGQVTARKPLMARLSLPAFLTESDQQVIAATVANDTDREMQVRASLDATGVKLAEAGTQNLTIPAQSTRPVTWTVTASTPGQAVFRLTAMGQGVSDGVEQRISVHARGLAVVTSASDVTDAETTLSVDLPRGATHGGLEISLTPSYAGMARQAIQYLMEYPYSCTEQTASRLTGLLTAQRLAQAGAWDDTATAERLPEEIAATLMRLRALQHPDGGWGWWEADETDEAMTGLALEVLKIAANQGSVRASSLAERGAAFAEARIREPLSAEGWTADKAWRAKKRVQLAYGLSLWRSSPEVAGALETPIPTEHLDAVTLAQRVIGWKRLQATGRPEAAGKAAEAYQALLAKAEETASLLNWDTNEWDREATAAGLNALVAMEPDSPRIGKVLRYLGEVRRGQGWASTRDTAMVVAAVSEYLVRGSELRPDYGWSVRVNGRAVGTGRFERVGSSQVLKVPFEALTPGRNEVRLGKQGPGRLYATAKITGFVPQQTAHGGTTLQGMTLDRQYVRMEPTRQEDGTLRLVPGATVRSARSGEVFHVRLTLTVPDTQSYVMIEDPIPSHCRIVDNEARQASFESSEDAAWGYWWSRSVYLDDKATLFAGYLAKGRHVFEYAVRAESPGLCVAAPAVASRMYQPDLRAYTPELAFEVKPR